MKRNWLVILIILLVAVGCQADPEGSVSGYRQISQQQAMEIMSRQQDYVILDVRTEEEYAGGHLPGAICIPNEDITQRASQLLPDKQQLILVYCRSGNRSKQASEKLAAMGYENVLEFGGINSWSGEIVTE